MPISDQDLALIARAKLALAQKKAPIKPEDIFPEDGAAVVGDLPAIAQPKPDVTAVANPLSEAAHKPSVAERVVSTLTHIPEAIRETGAKVLAPEGGKESIVTKVPMVGPALETAAGLAVAPAQYVYEALPKALEALAKPQGEREMALARAILPATGRAIDKPTIENITSAVAEALILAAPALKGLKLRSGEILPEVGAKEAVPPLKVPPETVVPGEPAAALTETGAVGAKAGAGVSEAGLTAKAAQKAPTAGMEPTAGPSEVVIPLEGKLPKAPKVRLRQPEKPQTEEVAPEALKTPEPISGEELSLPTPSDKFPVLAKVENILTAPKRLAPAIRIKEAFKQIPGKLQTLFTQEFKPVSQVETQIYKDAGIEAPKVPLSAKLEQVAGAPGKAHADFFDFVNNVIKPLPRNLLSDFKNYLVLKRIEDRLMTNPETRKVGDFTLEQARQGLEESKAKLGPEAFAEVEKRGNVFQAEADKALRLQVESGRMSEERYQQIKGMNQFYARFKVLKYMDKENPQLPGTGRGIATKQDLTKAIEGMSEETLKGGLEDPLRAQAEQIYRSRILAEKNNAMREVAKLADIPQTNEIVKRINPGDEPAEGFARVDYLENGEPAALQVPKDMGEALKGLNKVDIGFMGKALAAFKLPLQTGATTLSAGFQLVNYPLDQIRAAIMSKYGLRPSATDLARYPLDMAQGLFASLTGNFNLPNKIYLDWLRSGEAYSTASQWIRPEAFAPSFKKADAGKFLLKPLTIPLDAISRLSSTLEQSTKITQHIRGKRLEGFADLSPAEQATRLPEIVMEIRRYGGSPDFFRFGRWGRPLNLLFPFFNPATQGVAADVGRLVGITGARNAAASLAKATAVIGAPTLYLVLNNLSDEYRKDYEKISDNDKNNYFWIPTPDSAKDQNGDFQRVWITVPKKHVVQLFANFIESAVRYADKRDPEELKQFAGNTLKNLSPINISGESAGEIGESIVGATNPALSVPFKTIANRETYYHRPIVPERISGVESQNLPAAEQYKTTTPKLFVELGRLTQTSPLMVEAIIKGFTGGAVSQFFPPKLQEGEPGIRAIPGLSRLAKRPGKIIEPMEESVKQSLEKQAASQIATNRRAEELFNGLQNQPREVISSSLWKEAQSDPDVVKRVFDLAEEKQLGLTYSERLIKQLQVENGERAAFLNEQLNKLATPEEKQGFLWNMAQKKILTKEVYAQMQQNLKSRRRFHFSKRRAEIQ